MLPENIDEKSYAYLSLIGQIPKELRLGPIRIHTGAGTPAATLGANNDFYFNATGTAGAASTVHVIFHKEAGAWVALLI